LQNGLIGSSVLTVQTRLAALSEHKFCSSMVRRIFSMFSHRWARSSLA
jgi:hypothetical protein